LEGVGHLKVEETQLVRKGKRAVLAVLASLLLASCATSSDDEFFGYSVAPTSTAGMSADIAPQPVSASDSPAAPSPLQFVMDESDAELPQDVASAPASRPLSAGEAAALEAAQAVMQQAIPDPVAAAAAPAMTASADPLPATAAAPAPQPTAFVENTPPAQDTVVASVEEPKKRGFLSSFFGNNRAEAAPQQPVKPLFQSAARSETNTPPAQPIVQVASASPQPATRPLIQQRVAASADALPGVRAESLFEISRRSGMDDDSDIDLYEDEEPVQVASAAGLARLAPNGLARQTDNVDVACLKPSLVRVLKNVEKHFGKPVIVTSGYRGVDRNRRARGARNSLHMYCAAADIQIEGVSKAQLATFMRSMPGRGGVGTYCHTQSVHVDVGPERDWNWRCRRRK
jgi:uncharacterized protein YcbK (DUF882 family)